METNPSPAVIGPSVKVTPTIKKGDHIYCKSTMEKFKVLQVLKGGNLVCEGRAGVMPKEAALTELPESTEED